MTKQLKIFTDGGARGNPGPAAIGVVIYGENGEVVTKINRVIGETTNNVAEYRAVLEACNYLAHLKLQPEQVDFYLDSLLVVEQLRGVYKTKKIDLKELLQQVKSYERQLTARIYYHHVPRAENSMADRLVNEALDRQ